MENTTQSNGTHWRGVYKSDFLANWDFDRNETLTIQKAEKRVCSLSKGQEVKVVADFVEKTLSNGVSVKPMIINPTNCKLIQAKCKSGFLSDWSGVKLVIGVKENKGRIGNKKGLTIVEVIPVAKKPILTKELPIFEQAKIAWIEGKQESVLTRYSVSEDLQKELNLLIK